MKRNIIQQIFVKMSNEFLKNKNWNMCIMKFWKCVSAYAKNKLIYKYQHWDKMSDIMNELV